MMSPGRSERRLSTTVCLVCGNSPRDVDVDLADLEDVAFLDAIDHVELARLFEEPQVGLHVGEDVPLAAVQVDQRVHVLVRFAPG